MKKLSLEELQRDDLDTYKAKAKIPIVLVMDNVRSALNVGSAFRTGDGFAIEKIYLLGITASPPHREIQKSAIGATASVEWEYFKETSVLIEHLKKNAYTLIPVEQTDESTQLQDFKPLKSGKYALIFGNEVKGVDDEFIKEANICLELPQFGTKHSFNVSVCIGMVLWDFWSKMTSKTI